MYGREDDLRGSGLLWSSGRSALASLIGSPAAARDGTRSVMRRARVGVAGGVRESRFSVPRSLRGSGTGTRVLKVEQRARAQAQGRCVKPMASSTAVGR